MLLSVICYLSIFILLYVFITKRKTLQRIFKLNLSHLDPYKERIFASLNDMQSHDHQLSEKGLGCLRILEIGIGLGSNLKYYPPNTHLIAVEPNAHFKKRFESNKDKFANITLEQWYTDYCENMSFIDDNSIDVVVSTHVLCSVSDANACLREIKRVLAPNGRLIYVEHVSYPNGSWLQFAQECVQPVWKIFSDDCRITAQTGQHIRDAGFSRVNEKYYVVKQLWISLMRPHIFGIAYK